MSRGQYQGGLAGHGEGGQELDGVHLDGTGDAGVVVGGHVPSPRGREVSVPYHHQQFSPLTLQDIGVVCQGGGGERVNHPGEQNKI